MASPNPLYGTGAFRRRLSWHAMPGRVDVAVEDNNHGFRLSLQHDGERITGLSVDPVRYPFTTCPEAVRNAQQIVGLMLTDVSGMRARLPQPDNCTHMIDMSLFAAAHAGSNDLGVERLYDIAVADERDDVTQARIECDGRLVHDWTIRAHTLEQPGELTGKPVMRGFFAWASQMFTGMPLEAAQILQRGYFVAQARRWRYEPIEQHPARSDGMPVGACYSYNTGAVERALRIKGSVRDYSKSSERLLQFADAP